MSAFSYIEWVAKISPETETTHRDLESASGGSSPKMNPFMMQQQANPLGVDGSLQRGSKNRNKGIK